VTARYSNTQNRAHNFECGVSMLSCIILSTRLFRNYCQHHVAGSFSKDILSLSQEISRLHGIYLSQIWQWILAFSQTSAVCTFIPIFSKINFDINLPFMHSDPMHYLLSMVFFWKSGLYFSSLCVYQFVFLIFIRVSNAPNDSSSICHNTRVGYKVVATLL